jgi:hypothetical protein
MNEIDQDLIERRVNCKIWFHLLLWFVIPLGWGISAFKMRYSLPVYAMLAAICMSAITLPPCPDCSFKERFGKGSEHTQRYSFAASVLGATLTVREILESRRKHKSLVNSASSGTGHKGES